LVLNLKGNRFRLLGVPFQGQVLDHRLGVGERRRRHESFSGRKGKCEAAERDSQDDERLFRFHGHTSGFGQTVDVGLPQQQTMFEHAAIRIVVRIHNDDVVWTRSAQ
jgi:hypothetical protein